METATQKLQPFNVIETPPAQQNKHPDDMRRLTETLAGRAVENGNYALEHGEYINSLSAAFAKAVLDLGTAYGRDVLAAEGRRTQQLKRQLGNVERGPTPQQG